LVGPRGGFLRWRKPNTVEPSQQYYKAKPRHCEKYPDEEAVVQSLLAQHAVGDVQLTVAACGQASIVRHDK
jgi:hypothetical protein